MARSSLEVGESLRAGEVLIKPPHILAMQLDDNLVLYKNFKEVWASGTANRGGGVGLCRLAMETNGLFIYDINGTVLWSGTSNVISDRRAYRVDLEGNGNVVVYGPSGNNRCGPLAPTAASSQLLLHDLQAEAASKITVGLAPSRLLLSAFTVFLKFAGVLEHTRPPAMCRDSWRHFRKEIRLRVTWPQQKEAAQARVQSGHTSRLGRMGSSGFQALFRKDYGRAPSTEETQRATEKGYRVLQREMPSPDAFERHGESDMDEVARQLAVGLASLEPPEDIQQEDSSSDG